KLSVQALLLEQSPEHLDLRGTTLVFRALLEARHLLYMDTTIRPSGRQSTRYRQRRMIGSVISPADRATQLHLTSSSKQGVGESQRIAWSDGHRSVSLCSR